MKEISKVRFDAMAGYARKPTAYLYGDEVNWLQVDGEKILIVVIRDRADEDFSAMFFTRDLKERFRWTDMTDWADTVPKVLEFAKNDLPNLLQELEEERIQGDEKGKPVDFFKKIVKPEKINKEFSILNDNEGFSPAREIIEQMMRWHVDADGNFVEQFQSTAFDARIWELYLFAMLQEAGLSSSEGEAIPDFVMQGLTGDFSIEATTVNPSFKEGKLIPPPPFVTQDERQSYLQEYMPIRFAGPLLAKMEKKYWERENVQDNPFVLAIQDFHFPGSMSFTRPALITYLYGIRYEWKRTAKNKLLITPKKIDHHKWMTKELPSGFFNLPDSKNISAVISNPNATLSKFNRMGLMAGFGSKRVKLTRIGVAVNHDKNSPHPIRFQTSVNSIDYQESWIEGLDVYHNPNALHPLPMEALPGAAHHYLMPDGQMSSTVPNWQPLSSSTLVSLSD
ncbi:hypothetical protein CSQ94_05050 [Janthinobacterium sp. BJB312]|nr:hypothetical protein CSQ94_05050 [Janthinobacterium sp. BJB312]